MITLITEFSEAIGFWMFTVEEDGEVIHWRPGFRTREDAERVGDAWIRHHLGGITLDEAEQHKADDDAEA